MLRERWIPVRRRSGSLEWIAPWQITDDLDGDHFVAVAAPRPDFTAALTEFLIGLVTTAAAPKNDGAWRKLCDQPPDPEALREAFETVSFAFDLDGDGPCFLQDYDADFPGEERSASALLIDAPGDNALRRNTDIFVKRGGAAALNRAAAAMALFTLQGYAPSGGQGHRTSLRGGGPLTAIAAMGDSLWGRVWPNVETQEQIEARRVEAQTNEHEHIFPWLGATRVSDKTGRPTTPADAHPLQAYWGMPRRIRLIFSLAEGEACALTGRADEMLVRQIRIKNFGTNYEGWVHPLTPHYRQKAGKSPPLLPIHGQPGGISYRDWLGLAMSRGGEGKVPAACVRHLLEQPRLLAMKRWRLSVFGYDMDNMKARGWVESEMPLFDVSDRKKAEPLQDLARALVAAAEIAAFQLTRAVKAALYENPKDAPGDFSFITERFWRDTEMAFFDALRSLADRLEAAPNDENPGEAQRRAWPRVLSRSALDIFDEKAPSEGLENTAMERLVRARYGLVAILGGSGKQGAKLFEHLSLMTPAQERHRAKTLEKTA